MPTTATSTEWARVINTTTRKFLKGEEDAIMRERKLFKRIKAAGNVKYNMGGDGVQWQVKKARAPVSTNNGAQSINFAPVNRWIKAFLDYQGYIVPDLIYEREKLKNADKTSQLVDVFGTMAQNLVDDIADTFAEEIYVDDSAAGNSGRISGFESMFAATQTIDESTTGSTAARTANAADRLYYPNDTYAGISTVLGSEGGSWNANWPQGKGDAEFDFYSPTIVNMGSTAFDGTHSTVVANGRLSIAFGLIHQRKNVSSKGRVNYALFDAEMFFAIRNFLDAAERIVVNQGTKDREFGLDGDELSIEGCACTWEYGIPQNVGYGMAINQIEIWSMYDKLFEAVGPYEDEESNAWRMAVKNLGQIKFYSPRNFIKWRPGTGTVK